MDILSRICILSIVAYLIIFPSAIMASTDNMTNTYNVTIDAIPMTGDLNAGNSRIYNITVNNTGNTNGNYTLSMSDSDMTNFTVSILGNTTMEIGNGSGMMTTLTVGANAGATDGAVDITTINVFSVDNSAYTDSVQVVTTVNIFKHDPGNKRCIDCHAGVHKRLTDKLQTPEQIVQLTQQGATQNAISSTTSSVETTNVVGNINIITSMGQDWYQQGIYGPDNGYGIADTTMDKSWGWTFFDENPASGFITPPENVTQRNNIYALLLDDGNNSNPITGATVVANVTYWAYDNVSYVSRVIPVQLTEDTTRKGFYSGRFDFYGGTTYAGYSMRSCDGCHSSLYGVGDTQIGYFPGNYTVSVRADANGKTTTVGTGFEVTAWGCEDCHGSGNQHRASADMDSACYMCHGANEIVGMSDAGNPHLNSAHRDIQCTDCHTGKSLDSSTFNGVTFGQGGINGNRSIPQYSSSATQLSKGKHSTMTCIDCHNSLTLPSPSGDIDSYSIDGTVNNYDNSFASMKQFNDYYVVNGDSTITLNWDGVANLGFYLYPPGFNPKNGIAPPIYDGATPANKPEIRNSSGSTSGQWILQVTGYDLRYDFPDWNSWGGVLQPPINYTITSSYPIQKKDLPSTPECNSCHSSSVPVSDPRYTTDAIPDWNPGFAHADTNGDGTLDVQCRMCHNSMHDIEVKTCQTCHSKAPTGHFIGDPEFGQYTVAQCLECHGDPHKVIGGESCIACHTGEGDKNDVNISKFGRHANVSKSEGLGIVSDNDCWTCHYNKDMNKSSVYLCESCHTSSDGVVQVTDPSLLIEDFSHGPQQCKNCHAPVKYHINGKTGPKGAMDFLGLS